MNLLKRINAVIASIGMAVFMIAMPMSVHAADGIQQNLCAGANLDVNTNCNTGGITNQDAENQINRIIKTVINFFSLIVGVVSVIMIIVGGLKYITSGGDSSNVTGAKNTILYAIIGLVIVALAQFIIRFVLTKITQ